MRMKAGTLRIALGTIGALLVGEICAAQETPVVIVEVPHVEKSTQTGSMGRKEALSIVYKVDYSDLNLGTHSGAVELQKRIKDSASRACQELAKLFPDSSEGETPCVQGAVKNAMVQANKLISAAEAGK
jgi:UrcA family protein